MAVGRRSLRSYTPEFVDQAVRTAMQAHRGMDPARRSLRSVSVELAVPWPSLYRWLRRAHPDKFGRFQPTRTSARRAEATPVVDVAQPVSGNGPTNATVDAIRQDHERLVRENAILKAALALLARDSGLPTVF